MQELVGVAPAGATDLAGRLARAGDRLRDHGGAVARLLNEAGVMVRAPFLVEGAGRWAAWQASDLRWRIDVIAADPWAFEIGGLRYDVPAFGSFADAAAAGRAAADRVLALFDDGLRLGSEEDAHRFLDDLRAQLLVVGANDPAFAAAFFNELGADGTLFVLRVVDEAGGAILHDWDTGPDVLEPFDRLFAAATRARAVDGSTVLDSDITDALLKTWNTDALEMLLWYGNGTRDPQFTAAAAAQALGPNAETVAPWVSHTRVRWPGDGDESLRSTVLHALDDSPEAAFLFVVAGNHGDVLTFHDSNSWVDTDALAADVLRQAIATFPSSRADKAAAEDALCRLIGEIADGDAGLSDAGRRVFAGLMQSRMGEIAERAVRGPGAIAGDPNPANPHAIAVTYDDLEAFLGKVLDDEEARGIFLAGAAAYTAEQARTGMADIAGAGGDPLAHATEFQSSASRIGAIYGLTEHALFEAGLAAKEAAGLLVGTLKMAGDVALSLGMGAAPLSDGAGAVAGAGAKWLLDEGAALLEGHLTHDVGESAAAVGAIVEQQLTRTMAATIYDNPSLRAQLVVAQPPAEFLDAAGHLVPPPPGSPGSDAFLGWLASQRDLESLALACAHQGYVEYIGPLIDALRDRELHS